MYAMEISDQHANCQLPVNTIYIITSYKVKVGFFVDCHLPILPNGNYFSGTLRCVDALRTTAKIDTIINILILKVMHTKFGYNWLIRWNVENMNFPNITQNIYIWYCDF